MTLNDGCGIILFSRCSRFLTNAFVCLCVNAMQCVLQLPSSTLPINISDHARPAGSKPIREVIAQRIRRVSNNK